MVPTPTLIDFESITASVKKQIENIEIILEQIENKIDILNLNQNLSPEEVFELADLNTVLEDVKAELTAKRQLHNEYNLRCAEMEQKIKAEQSDYMENKRKIRIKALIYCTDKNIPSNIRKHLSNVMNQSTKDFNLEQKVAYHLALKREVEICCRYHEV